MARLIEVEDHSLTKDSSTAHPSDQGPNEHSSVLMQDAQGGEVAKGHVTSDESKQEVGLSLFTLLLQLSWLTAHRRRAECGGYCTHLLDILIRHVDHRCLLDFEGDGGFFPCSSSRTS